MSTETVFAITVNGEPHDVPAESSLADVLRHRGIGPEQPGIAVARNEAVVRRALWAETDLEPGDAVEIITATQGG